MDPVEPQSASDYDDRTTAAVKSVLVEIGQILGSCEGKFAVIGGAIGHSTLLFLWYELGYAPYKILFLLKNWRSGRDLNPRPPA